MLSCFCNRAISLIEDHWRDRKSTRLNSSHTVISYAVFCLKKKNRTCEHQPHSYAGCRLLLRKRHIELGRRTSNDANRMRLALCIAIPLWTRVQYSMNDVAS